jgi:hypothetical protein
MVGTQRRAVDLTDDQVGVGMVGGTERQSPLELVGPQPPQRGHRLGAEADRSLAGPGLGCLEPQPLLAAA